MRTAPRFKNQAKIEISRYCTYLSDMIQGLARLINYASLYVRRVLSLDHTTTNQTCNF